MILLAFDPSLSATGYAVLQIDGSTHGRLIDAGRIVPDGETKDYPARLASLFREAKGLIDEHEAQAVVVELPSAHAPMQSRGMNRVGQPIYGAAVGAVLSAAAMPFRWESGERITPPRVLAFEAHEWTRGLPPECRRTRDDPHKERRVRFAATCYERRAEDFGARSNAGDVADAVLLGRHGVYVLESETQRSMWRAGA